MTHHQMLYLNNYINEHVSRSISTEELADLLRIPTYRFSRSFRQAFGKSPHFFVTGIRMENAKKKLSEGDSSILQVALSVGYENPSHFTRVFKKFYGLAPSDFQKSQEEINEQREL